MRFSLWLTGCGLACGSFLGPTADAQQPLPATTVQLPTVSQFTMHTTVSVPDGGTMNLGGVGRGFDSSVSRGLGPLRSRGLAGGRMASGVSISTRIIDHAEIDRAVLAAAAGGVKAPESKTEALSRAVAHGPAPAQSVAAIRAEAAAAADREARELADLFAKAEAAESSGKAGAAKIYYQMVMRRASGQLKDLAGRRFAALAAGSALK